MNIKASANVFPSYREIQEKAQQNYIKQYQQKIKGLQAHLTQLKAQHDFEKDHQQIHLSIMTLSAQNNQEDQPQKGKLKTLTQQQKKIRNSGDYGESLNYYLEDDGEEENNFQTFLKFKKKTLQRDLEEEMKVKGSSQIEKKKQKEEEELFFRKLYVSQPEKDANLVRRCVSANKPYRTKKGTFDYKESKENAGNFLRKLNKRSFQSSKNINPKVTTTKKIRGGEVSIESEIATFEKNRKYLSENYLDILKKLDSTNIVKWRILNEKQEGQRGLV